MKRKDKIINIFLVVFFLIFIINVFKPFMIPLSKPNVKGTSDHLKSGDIIQQKLQLDSLKTNSLVFRFATYGERINNVQFSISLHDGNNKLIHLQEYNYEALTDGNYISFNIPNEEDLEGMYLLTINITNVEENEVFTIYVNDKSEYDYEINGVVNNGFEIYTLVNGYTRSSLCMWVSLLSIVVLIFVKSKNKEGKYKILDKLFISKRKFLIYFLICFGWSFLIIVLAKYPLKGIIKYILPFVVLFLSIIITNFISKMIEKKDLKIEKIFLLLAIPIGWMYTIYILPMESPDSQFHYNTAYQLSQFNIGQKPYTLPKIVYDRFYNRSTSYSEYFHLIQEEFDYNDTTEFNRGIYNPIEYIPSAVGIFIGRIINVSPYIGMYFSKILNFITFIVVGFYCIKLIPFGKSLLLIYFLNPIFLQQATSLSIDAMINLSAIFFVTYILYLKSKVETIKLSQILLLAFSLLMACIQKIVYFPLVLLLFLLLKQLKNMSKKDKIIAVLTFFIVSVICIFWYLNCETDFHEIIPNTLTGTSYFFQDIIRFIYALYNDFIVNGGSYFHQAFGGYLGWTSLPIPILAVFLYIILCVLSIFIDEEKTIINGWDKIIMSLSYIGTWCLIALGIYVSWSEIGNLIIDGIQGRYFLPVNFMLFLMFYKNLKIESINFKRKHQIILALLFIIHLLAIYTILINF